MNRHCRCLRDERIIAGHCQGHSYTVPPAENQGYSGLGEGIDHFSDGQARLHITADCIQYHQQPLYFGVLFYGHQLGNDVFILGGLVLRRQGQVTFDLTDNGQRVDIAFQLRGLNLAQLLDIFQDGRPLRRRRLRLLGSPHRDPPATVKEKQSIASLVFNTLVYSRAPQLMQMGQKGTSPLSQMGQKGTSPLSLLT